MMAIAYIALLLAFSFMGFIVGHVIFPRFGLSQRTEYRDCLRNTKLGDYVASLDNDGIHYTQFELGEYTVTFQKIRYLQEGQPLHDNEVENYFPAQGETSS